jgi:septum formation protein
MLLHQQLESYSLILASQSPRRKALLKGLDVNFTVRLIPDLDESFPSTLKGADVPVYLAEKKAQAYTLTDNEILITADTVVLLDNEILNKPIDLAHARELIQKLSGRKHEVVTGVCLSANNKKHSFSASSMVHVAPLTAEEINFYVEKYKPLDKAGAYGVQEWIGFAAIERIEGSYFNVMGLPVQQLYNELKAFIV